MIKYPTLFLACAATGYVLLVLVFLHFVRKDLSVLSSPISEYAIGPYGRWMTSALWMWCIAGIALAIGVQFSLKHSTLVLLCTALLLVFGVGLAIAAVFPMDESFQQEGHLEFNKLSMTGKMHISGASLSAICFPIAAVLLSVCFREGGLSQQVQVFALEIAAVCLIATIVSFVVFKASYHYFGIAQRSFVAADLAWLILAAIALLAKN